MYAADWIVDVGPGAGLHGGKIVVPFCANGCSAHPYSSSVFSSMPEKANRSAALMKSPPIISVNQ